jgi:shikimate kinase
MNRIFLIGFMGSGKSTLGKELASKLNCTFIESDAWIEAEENRTIAEIFEQSGEPYFRQLEKNFLFYTPILEDCIIATGGGMPCYENNMEVMKKLGTTIFLEVEWDILVERLKKEIEHRPLLLNSNDFRESIDELLQIRNPFYKMADITVANPTIDELRSKIVNLKLISPFNPNGPPCKASTESR